MTVWIRHMALSPGEEDKVTREERIALPLNGLPDLSMVDSPVVLRHLLEALHPDAPPEKLLRLQERTWQMAKGIEPEDIIAIPLKHKKTMVLAEVSGPYGYDTDASGDDMHYFPVQWNKKTIPFRRFGSETSAFAGGGSFIEEVTDAKMRTTIRNAMPYSYNRFTAIKWLLGAFVVWRFIEFMVQRGGF